MAESIPALVLGAGGFVGGHLLNKLKIIEEEKHVLSK